MKALQRGYRIGYIIFSLALLGDAITVMLGISIPILAFQLGANALDLGLLGASFASIYTFVPVLMGFFSESFGYRRMIITALLLRGSVCLIYLFSRSLIQLIPARIIEGIAISLLWPSFEAFIAASYSDNIDKALKKFNIAWSLGWVLGPSLASIFLMIALKLPFAVACVFNFSLGIICILELEDPIKIRDMVVDKDEFITPRLVQFVAICTAFSVGFAVSMILAFFPAQAVAMDISSFEIGMMVAAFGTTRLFSFSVLSSRGEGDSRSRRAIFGCLFIALAMTPFWLNYGRMAYYLGFLVMGLGSALAYSSSISLMLRGTGGKRGFRSGVFESSIGLAWFTGPLIGGLVARSDPYAIYLLTLIVGVTAAIINLLSKPLLRRNNQLTHLKNEKS